MLSTQGGSVMHGMNLYNLLRALPIELTIHNVGNVDSIGNVVFFAGSKRFAYAHSTFMFHGVGFDMDGKYPARRPDHPARSGRTARGDGPPRTTMPSAGF
jgi:hypothetical protein